MARRWTGSDVPEPPSATVILTEHCVVHRLNGRPRDPEDGRHRRVVVFTGPMVSRGELAGLLRDVADRLESGRA